MKRFIIKCICIIGPILGIILVLSFMLHSCFGTKKYTEDYIEKYDEYLRHAFGDYEAKDIRYEISNGMRVPVTTNSYLYHISYINDAGIKEEFYFRNIPGALESAISNHINNYSESILWEEYISPYFSNSRFVESSIFRSDVSRNENDQVDEKLLDPKEGLQFRNFDITSLSKYDLRMMISLDYKFAIDEPWETEEITALFVAMLEEIYQDLHAPDLLGYITFYDDEVGILSGHDYKVIFDKKVGRMIVEEIENYDTWAGNNNSDGDSENE